MLNGGKGELRRLSEMDKRSVVVGSRKPRRRVLTGTVDMFGCTGRLHVMTRHLCFGFR